MVVIVGFILGFSAPTSAQTMNTINFQGKVVRNDAGSEGLNVSSSETSCISGGADTCGFQVVYYDASTGGNTLGTETFTNVEIGDYDGVVNLGLGTGSYSAGTESTFVDIFTNNSTTYAEVKFDHDGNATYTEVFGRMAVRGAAYAVRADTADSINGMDEGDFVQLAPSSVQTDTSTISTIFINKTGASGNILQLQKDGSDELVLNNSGQLGIGITPTNALHVYNDANATGVFFLEQASSLTGHKDVFEIESQDYMGGGQDESSIFKVYQNANIANGADGFSLVELTMAGTVGPDTDESFYILGRRADEGAVEWGVSLDDSDIWTTGGLNIGATGTNCSGTDAACFNSASFAVSSGGAITAATGITSSGTITFSGLSTAGVTMHNASGVLSTATVQTCSGDDKLQFNGTNFVCSSDTDTTYSAGNDIDFNGTQIDIEGTLNYVTTITRASSDLTLSTTTSGDIVLNPAGNIDVRSHIVPNTDDTYDLGTSSLRFRDLYLGPTSIHIGDDGDEGVISYVTASNRLDIDVAEIGGTGFTNWDKNYQNDLTTATSFSGDVSGAYNNLQLGAGVVENADLANSSLTVGAGSGMTGGGSISLGGSGTLNVIGGNGITANADDIAIDSPTCSGNDKLQWTGTAFQCDADEVNDADASTTNEIQDLWDTIQSQSGNTTADSATDTLTINGGGIASTAISGDILTITATEAQQIFTTIAVSGQSNVVTDTLSDTLTFIAGTNVSLTTNATNDSVTINSTDQYVGTVTNIASGNGITGGPITSTGTLSIDSPTCSGNDKLQWTGTAFQCDADEVNDADASTTNEIQDLWDTIQSQSGSTTADSSTDTLTINGGGIASTAISGDTLTITATEAQQLFRTIAVSGESNVVADGTTDTLTFVEGSNINITTNATSDSVTIANTYSYSHPTGFSNQPASALTGANVISQISVNTNGHVTGVSTRGLTPGDIGAQPAGTYDNYVSWTAQDGDTTQYTVTSSDVLQFADGGTVTVNFTGDDVLTISAADQYVGTVTNIATGNGITGGPITSTGTVSIDSPTCSGNDKLQWTGSAFQCDADEVNDADANASNELQDLFSTIAVSGQSNVVADANSDTLTFVAGSNVSLTTNATSDSVTINATNTTYSAGNDIDFSGTQINIESTLNYVSTITRASSDLTLSTTTSGDIVLNPAGNIEIGSHILPDTDDSLDIGSSSYRIRDLYLGPSSLHIGADSDEATITFDTATDTLTTTSAVHDFSSSTDADSYNFTISTALTGEKDGFNVIDPDNSGSGQDEGSSFKVHKTSAINSAADGFSLVELTYSGGGTLDPNENFYLLGRTTDEGDPSWGVSIVGSDSSNPDIWTAGGLAAGATPTACGNTNAPCFNSPTFAVTTAGNLSATNATLGGNLVLTDQGIATNAGSITISPTTTTTFTGSIYLGNGASSTDVLYIPYRIYDYDDNAYYLDPNATSVLSTLTVSSLGGSGVSGWDTDASDDIITSGTQTRSGNLQVYSTDTTGSYSNAAIEIREVNLVTTGQSSWAYAPGLAFHWGGRVATQMKYLSSNVIAIGNSDGGYTNFAAQNIWANGGISTYDNSPTDNYIEAGGLCLGNGTNCRTTWPAEGTTYSAGNDLDLSGSTFNIESTLNYVSTITRASSNLTLSTTTSGQIYLNPANNVYIGGASTNADDLYIADRIIDWDSTSYYLDPNSTSYLNSLNIAGSLNMTDGTILDADEIETSKISVSDTNYLDIEMWHVKQYNGAIPYGYATQLEAAGEDFSVRFGYDDDIDRLNLTANADWGENYDGSTTWTRDSTSWNGMFYGLMPNDTSRYATWYTYNGSWTELARIDSTGKGWFNNGTGTFSPYLSYNYTEVGKTKSYYQLGDVVSLTRQRWTVARSTPERRDSVLGVKVVPEGFISVPKEMKDSLWDEGGSRTPGENPAKDIESIPNVIPVANLGEASTKVTLIDGTIYASDPIMVSDLESFGSKAVTSGQIVGKALESTTSWDTAKCPVVSSIGSIQWPADDGSNPSKPCYRVPVSSLPNRAAIKEKYGLTDNQYVYVGKIMVFVNVTHYQPNPVALDKLIDDYEAGLLGGSYEGDVSFTSLTADSADFIALSVGTGFNVTAQGDVSVSGDLVLGTSTISSSGGLLTVNSDLEVEMLIADSIKINRGSGSDRSVGVSTITAGQTSVTVNSTHVKPGSIVLLTPRGTSSGSVPVVGTRNIIDGSFEIVLNTPLGETIEVDWMIIK